MKGIYLFIRSLLALDYDKAKLDLRLWGPRFFQRMVWDYYCTGYCTVSVNDIRDVKLRDYYEQFLTDGFVVLKKACNNVDFSEFSTNASTVVNFSRSMTKFTPEQTKSLINSIDPTAKELITLIYGREYWIRDVPFLMKHKGQQAMDHIQSSWHIDGYMSLQGQYIFFIIVITQLCIVI